MNEDRVRLTVVAGVAEIHLSRPAAGNAIDPEMVESIDEAVRAVEADDTVRSVLVTAAGPAFCVGGDLRFFRDRIDRLHEDLSSMIGTWHRSTLRRLSELRVPVVAAARGGIGGGGLGLLWGADVVIVSDNAKLATGFTRLGMTGDGGSTWHLPRLVGMRKAQQLALRSTPVEAEEALKLGLVSQVVSDDRLEETARAEAVELASGPTWAYGRIKDLLRESGERTYADHLVAELDAMLDGAERSDIREGVIAFVERRRPSSTADKPPIRPEDGITTMPDSSGTHTPTAEEQVRRLYPALARGDRDELSAILHPDFVGVLAEGMPFGIGGEHRGADEMRRHGWGGIARHFAAGAEPEQVARLTDDRVLVTGRYRGKGRRGGSTVDAAFAHIVTVDDGLITALEQYTDTARWAAAAPPYSTIDVRVTDGIASVTLNRPAQLNAFDAPMGAELARAVEVIAADRSVRAVVLAGSDSVFSVGGDLSLFTDSPPDELSARLRSLTDLYHPAIERLTAMDAPVVVGVHGAAVGVGLGLVCAADVVVAADDAMFATAYTGIGMTADAGVSWFLPRLVGLRRAQELLLTGRRLDAREALDWGLITTVVASAHVDEEVHRIASRLATGPTRAYGQVRRLLRKSFDSGLRDQLAAEQDSVAVAGATHDLREGAQAFAERRTPSFRGE
ncbi:enoyl-CoA hydratase-related protein [Pseudonocardia sp. EC080610-09]|nr:enoyl-CoA hydratase-related protein [Pseudonocardia sp. EC080610-09]